LRDEVRAEFFFGQSAGEMLEIEFLFSACERVQVVAEDVEVELWAFDQLGVGE
jgi:hypothetical protein